MGNRFIVEGETCFVTLLSGQKVGLVLHGETAMQEFCEEAISAYRQLIDNKRTKKRIDRILAADEKPKKEPAKKRRKTA